MITTLTPLDFGTGSFCTTFFSLSLFALGIDTGAFIIGTAGGLTPRFSGISNDTFTFVSVFRWRFFLRVLFLFFFLFFRKSMDKSNSLKLRIHIYHERTDYF